MANYYNVRGWKHTGFDFKNRPYDREVLTLPYFTDPDNYWTARGMTVNRMAMEDMTYIDLEGSVKDIRGDQINPANVTGSQGPGGPWYSLEETDYICLTRTGYPNDPDFIDISGHMTKPWETPHEGGKLFIAYYFVTGLRPLARNVTRVYLALDEWLTLGGADELEIETGYKIRGHITEAEDASGYNISPEGIGLTDPLITISSGTAAPENPAGEDLNIICSAIDLTQYTEGQNISAYVAQAAGGQTMSFPAIRAVSKGAQIQLQVPALAGGSESIRNWFIRDYGLFDGDDPKVKYNLSVLYSAGQLELQDSFTIPAEWAGFPEKVGGQFNSISNQQFTIPSPVSPDIGGYPRKADYLYCQEVLFSKASGTMNIQPVYELSDRSILLWAVMTPSGSPFARFKGVKGHNYAYDQAVPGIPWIKKAIVMSGASGSLWNQISQQFALNSQGISEARELNNNKQYERDFTIGQAETFASAGIAAAQIAGSGVSAKNWLSGGAETFAAAQQIASLAAGEARSLSGYYAEQKDRELRAQTLQAERAQINVSRARSEVSAPYISFAPDLSAAVFQPNDYGVYIVNTSGKDRARLKRYFRRYGYSGLYEPLTWQSIRVKEKVNYVEAEGALFRHHHYPARMTSKLTLLLAQGLFLWSDRPQAAAFEDNPDHVQAASEGEMI